MRIRNPGSFHEVLIHETVHFKGGRGGAAGGIKKGRQWMRRRRGKKGAGEREKGRKKKENNEALFESGLAFYSLVFYF